MRAMARIGTTDSPRTRLPLRLACVGAALAAGATPALAKDVNDYSKSPAHRAFFTQKLQWNAATCKGTAPKMVCARVRVPKSWAKPSLGSMHIVVSRPAKNVRRPRVLFTNPGGPGLPGLSTSSLAVETQGITKTHTPIGIDPRGVGLSSTQVCRGLAALNARYTSTDMRTLTEAQLTAYATAKAAVYRRCFRQPGSIIRYIDTPSAIRDAVLVMHLLHYRSVDYAGGSYGSWYGTVAARMFPSRFRRVVVDANTDFGRSRLVGVGDDQSESHQRSFDRAFLPWAARHNDELGLGADPAAVEATIERIRAGAKAGVFGPKVTTSTIDALNYQAARDLVMSSSIYAFTYSGLRKALDGDRTGLPVLVASLDEIANPSKLKATGLWEANNAYYCNDSGPGPSAAVAARTALRLNHQYPVVDSLEAMPACVGWPQSARWTPADVRRPLHGVLMTQAEDDAPTSYAGARHARFASRGMVRMVMLDDASRHGVSSDACVTRVTHRYLATGRFPTRDVHCQAPPLPGDRQVYEIGNPASAANPLPVLPPYLTRDFSMPSVDPTAPVNPNPGPVLQPVPEAGRPGTAPK